MQIVAHQGRLRFSIESPIRHVRSGFFYVWRKYMAIQHGDVIAVVARWLATARDELQELSADARVFVTDTRNRWSNDPAFRTSVLRAGLTALIAAAVRGPRATVLWVIQTLLSLVLAVIEALDQRPSQCAEAF
ncbi:hypothetical protein [Demequina aurantiaca]|uniref:hypothetical protein n=1 Tax=Demequina aurantiaca TaxID=676200 RepID=UPI003D32BA54